MFPKIIRKAGIGRKLIAYIFLFSSLVTFLGTSLQLYLDYANGIKSIQNTMRQIESSYLQSINSSLWYIDKQQVAIVLNGILRLPDMQYLEITQKGKLLISVGEPSEVNIIQREFPLSYPFKGKEKKLGVLKATASLTGIYRRLWNRTAVILGTQAVKTFLVSVFIFFIFHTLVGKHLIFMADYAKRFDFKRLRSPLRLKRKMPGNSDELETLVQSINIMRQNIANDMEERQQTEKKLRKNEESLAMGQKVSRTGSWDWDMAADRLTWSDEAYRQFGIDPQEMEPSYKAFESFVHPDDLGLVNRKVERALSGDKPYSVDARMTRRDGTEWIMHSQGVVYRNRDGKAIRFVGTQQDITDLKRAEQEKEELTNRLQQAQKMEAIGTLAGGIAHDFNNILSIILGYSEMAQEDVPPGTEVEKDLGEVVKAANRAKELVNQILAFSRQARIERVSTKIQPLIKEGLKMLRSSIPTTISITEDIDPASGAILADPTQVHQILMNLGTNAYHAMEESGGTLSVALKTTVIKPDKQNKTPHVKPGEYVELTVADTGSGIGPDLMEKIFDPYFTTKGIGKGTGMGLAIIHGIMTDCGGAITVESRLGQGTTFHVYFPVVGEKEMAEIKEHDDIPRGKERILFVDDEQTLAEMGRIMLERLGYHVTVRRSSLEALITFQNTPGDFDVVITDQTMPDMTGADLARRMMQIRPDIPIILCTGYSNLIDEGSAKAQGIKEFALKPLTKSVIGKLVRAVLDGAV